MKSTNDIVYSCEIFIRENSGTKVEIRHLLHYEITIENSWNKCMLKAKNRHCLVMLESQALWDKEDSQNILWVLRTFDEKLKTPVIKYFNKFWKYKEKIAVTVEVNSSWVSSWIYQRGTRDTRFLTRAVRKWHSQRSLSTMGVLMVANYYVMYIQLHGGLLQHYQLELLMNQWLLYVIPSVQRVYYSTTANSVC